MQTGLKMISFSECPFDCSLSLLPPQLSLELNINKRRTAWSTPHSFPLLWLHAGQDFPLLFPWYSKPLFQSILNTTAGPLTLFQLWDTLLDTLGSIDSVTAGSPMSQVQTHPDKLGSPPWHPCPDVDTETHAHVPPQVLSSRLWEVPGWAPARHLHLVCASSYTGNGRIQYSSRLPATC